MYNLLFKFLFGTKKPTDSRMEFENNYNTIFFLNVSLFFYNISKSKWFSRWKYLVFIVYNKNKNQPLTSPENEKKYLDLKGQIIILSIYLNRYLLVYSAYLVIST